MLEYPITLEMTAALEQDRIEWFTASENGSLEVGIPPQFGGDSEELSPEELYGLSLLNCYLATFKTLAGQGSFTYQQVDVDGEIVVDRDDDGKPWMSEMHLDVTVTDPEPEDQLDDLHEQTLENCFIHRSVRTEIVTDLTVEQL